MRKYLLWSGAFILGFAQLGFAGALSNNMVGVRAASMQSAFTGVADDSSAVFYNPAGLAAKTKDNWDAQIHAWMSSDNLTITPTGGDAIKSNTTSIVPGLFISKKMDNIGFGLGIYAPYGGGSYLYKDYPMTGLEMSSSFGAYAITPAFAYQFSPSFSAGLGVSAYYGSMTQKLENTLAPDDPFTNTDLNLSGLAGYGCNVGIMFKAMEGLNLGFELRSPVAMKVSGKTNIGNGLIESDTTGEVTMPMAYNVGVGWQASPAALISFDVWYEPWSATDKLTLTIDDTATELETNYQNFVMVAAGLDYKMMSNLSLLAGLSYNQGGTKDDGMGLDCDTDCIVVSVGLGYDLSESFTVTLAGMYAYGLNKTVQDVTYDQKHTIFNAGLSSRF